MQTFFFLFLETDCKHEPMNLWWQKSNYELFNTKDSVGLEYEFLLCFCSFILMTLVWTQLWALTNLFERKHLIFMWSLTVDFIVGCFYPHAFKIIKMVTRAQNSIIIYGHKTRFFEVIPCLYEKRPNFKLLFSENCHLHWVNKLAQSDTWINCSEPILQMKWTNS